SEEMERLLTESRDCERREFAELRTQDRQEFHAALERQRQELAEAREHIRQEFAEEAEREQQHSAELREQDRRAFNEALANARQELADLREHHQQDLAAALERQRQELAEAHEQDRKEFEQALKNAHVEFGEAAERERQHSAELREQDRREFNESLANAREELVDLREHNQQEFAASLERERREFGDKLRQAVRRIRQSNDWEELAATLVDAAVAYSGGAAWLRVADGSARGGPVRGVATETAEAFHALEIPLGNAAALAGAVESRDPVIAAVAEGEVSAALLALPGHPTEGRVAIFPLVTKSGVPALLYTWGNTQEPVLEMLTEVASAAWEIRTPPALPSPAPELVRITPAAVPAVVEGEPARTAWEQLSADEQQIHLRAQRYARVQAAEMRLHEADAVESGRARRNLYELLQKPIDQARTTFHQRFFLPCPSMVDYLHLELVRTLANDDAELLGTDYPGPLV
ncbi:MAG TPA: hypothetical protein VME43_16710, partial [Bryobacteraceae bacterium]|nr:hypothetical protein [Bryobacteraceae bacterium]